MCRYALPVEFCHLWASRTRTGRRLRQLQQMLQALSPMVRCCSPLHINPLHINPATLSPLSTVDPCLPCLLFSLVLPPWCCHSGNTMMCSFDFQTAGLSGLVCICQQLVVDYPMCVYLGAQPGRAIWFLVQLGAAGAGIDADVFMEVTSMPSASEACEGVIAGAIPAIFEDVTYRPIFGIVRLCQVDKEHRDSDIATVVHELMHALVRPSSHLRNLYL